MSKFEYLISLIAKKLKKCVKLDDVERLSKKEIEDVVKNSKLSSLSRSTSKGDATPRHCTSKGDASLKRCTTTVSFKDDQNFMQEGEGLLVGDYEMKGDISVKGKFEMYFDSEGFKLAIDHNKLSEDWFNTNEKIAVYFTHGRDANSYARLFIEPSVYLPPLKEFIKRYNKRVKSGKLEPAKAQKLYIDEDGLLASEI